MTVNADFIGSLPYFAGLDGEELGSVLRFISEKKFSRGELITFEEEPAEALFFVVSGVVKVFKTSADGKEQILFIVRPGESFNDVPALSDGTNLASAEAMGEVVLNMVKKSDFETILQDHPRVAQNVIRVLSHRIQHLVSLVEDLSFRNVTGRVAKILLEYASDGTGDRPHLTQQEMAAMIGTAREMVGRSLKVLEGEGTIKLDRHRIIITNRRALQDVAGVSS